MPFNLGVGGAVRTGLRYAVDHDVDRVVVVDADGQHDPADIDRLLDALDDGAEMAIGSRFAPGADGYDMGHTRRRAQRFLNWVVRKTTGFPATDATSGFRAFDRSVVEFLADRYPVEYLADTVEVIVLTRSAGRTVVEVPVGMRQRSAGVPSSRSLTLLINYLRLLVGILGTAFVGRRERRAR
jgi:glycosyltransferase involved in cell wall biosynthesis